MILGSSSDSKQPGGTRKGLGAMGASCARHPLLVIALWLVVVVALLVGRQLVGGSFSDKISVSGTQASTGLNLLGANEPTAGGYAGQIVFHVQDGSLAMKSAVVEQAIGRLKGLPHVLSVSDPLSKTSAALSRDGRTAVITVRTDAQSKTLGKSFLQSMNQATSPARNAQIEVAFGSGFEGLTARPLNDRRSEVVGFGIALVVLLVGFGSILAGLLPLIAALMAVAAGMGLLGIAAGLMTFGSTAPTLAIMIGLGVGIDYALFLTTRFRQLVIEGADPVEACRATVEKSGHAVLVAAGTVSIALIGLYASGVTFLGQLGLAAVLSVVASAIASLTLVPALLGLLGKRIDRLKVRRPAAEATDERDGWQRYAHTVSRHPWSFLAFGLVVLAILAIPLFSIQLGHIDDGSDPKGSDAKRAYDLVAQAFGPGANGTLTVVVDTQGSTKSIAALEQDVAQALRAAGDVAQTTPLQPSANGKILVATVVPATSPQDAKANALFERLAHDTLPKALAGTGAHAYVTGTTALQLEFGDRIASRLPIVICVIAAMAFLLLMVTFRSPVIALKAAVLNLLSIGAAYGVIVAVFQYGWGRGLLGVSENVPIESYVPVFMFAIVFGLSMDYEVFLLSRIKEGWDATGNNTEAVASGLARTARVITCAALIMASVFMSFALSPNVVIKMLAVGLAVSVLVDATLVRLVLVPATMRLFGRANWWIPSWLDRIVSLGRGRKTAGQSLEEQS